MWLTINHAICSCYLQGRHRNPGKLEQTNELHASCFGIDLLPVLGNNNNKMYNVEWTVCMYVCLVDS